MWDDLKLKVVSMFSDGGIILAKAVLTFIVGVLLIKAVLKVTNRILAKSRVEKIARKFLYNLVKYVLYLLLLMTIASMAGIPTAAFVAVISAAGLAISLALQGSLSNFANGIVIIASKPFKEGDVVTVGDYTGVIKEIRMTHTILTNNDDKEISIPNKIIVESVVLNNSSLEKRKITYRFLVSYKSDVQHVRKVILSVFAKTNMILDTPKPAVILESLETNGIKFMATCYVEHKDHRDVYYPVQEAIFNELKRERIVFPHAMMEVKLNNEKDAALPFQKTVVLKQKAKSADFDKAIHVPAKDKEQEEPEQETVFASNLSDNKKVAEDNDSELLKDVDKDYLDYVNEVKVIEEEIDEEGDVIEVPEPESEQEDEPEQVQTTKKQKFFRKQNSGSKKSRQKVVIKRTK